MISRRRTVHRLGLCLIALATIGTTSCATSEVDDALLVAAASDLRPAFEELGATFERDTGTGVTFTFGSSGQLREQIVNGAPFDVFASANGGYVDDVIDAGLADPSTRSVYAIGRLVIVAAPGVELPRDLDEVAARVEANAWRVAIANPEHAPYGMAAEQALTSVGAIGDLRPRLVFGESVADALRIVRSGNAELGLVARSLAIDDGLDHVDVDDALHLPIEQTLVVVDATDDRARAFADFLLSDDGRAVLRRFGFETVGNG